MLSELAARDIQFVQFVWFRNSMFTSEHLHWSEHLQVYSLFCLMLHLIRYVYHQEFHAVIYLFFTSFIFNLIIITFQSVIFGLFLSCLVSIMFWPILKLACIKEKAAGIHNPIFL